MGYTLQAIVGPHTVLAAHSTDFPSAVVAPLGLGLALIPITDELLDEVGAFGYISQFYKLSPALLDWLRSISATAPAAYIEAEFFGGVGGQGAVVFARGEQLLAPVHSLDAINIALRHLGVSRGASRDEFQAVGLRRHRDTTDWLDDALPKH